MWNERQLLVREFTILELDREVSAETIRLRQRTRLKLPDAIIWATARVHDLQLVTCNSRDFSANDPGIRIPYKRRPA
jgi:predicted nucleic acid-binding protein